MSVLKMFFIVIRSPHILSRLYELYYDYSGGISASPVTKPSLGGQGDRCRIRAKLKVFEVESESLIIKLELRPDQKLLQTRVYNTSK